jgi:prepilin peptidase CpaA
MTATMTGQQLIWTLSLLLAAFAGLVDYRTRKIPNWLTISGIGLGIGVNAMVGGWPGCKASLLGAGLALGLLLPLVLLRALGAGDWKLMGAVGALMGWRMMLVVLVFSILAAGLMAVLSTIRTKRMISTLKNIWILMQGFVTFGLRPNPDVSLDNPALIKLPFGVAVAAATVTCYLIVRFHVTF